MAPDFLDIMEDAPWVPVFNQKRYTTTWSRLDRPKGILVVPVHVPVFHDYVFVKDAQ